MRHKFGDLTTLNRGALFPSVTLNRWQNERTPTHATSRHNHAYKCTRYTHTRTHAHTHTHTRARARTHTHSLIHLTMQAYTHARAHIRTYARSNSFLERPNLLQRLDGRIRKVATREGDHCRSISKLHRLRLDQIARIQF